MSLTPKTPIPEGAIRFNTDSSKMEVWIGDKWMIVATSSPNLDGGSRGIMAGGFPGSTSGQDVIDHFNIESAGNAVDFGNLTDARWGIATGASRTRGLFAGGDSPGDVNIIDFITFSSTGNAQDFGDVGPDQWRYGMGLSNQTRFVIAGGATTPAGQSDMIQSLTIASQGNTVDSGGNLVGGDRQAGSCCCSPTRGIIAGGYTPGALNIIEFINMGSLGDSQDFGDTSSNTHTELGTCSSTTRGIIKIAIDGTPATQVDKIELATLGNSVNFGDANAIRSSGRSAGSVCSSNLRAIFMSGYYPGVNGATDMEYMNITTGGDTVDFGDLNYSARAGTGISNNHGGL